MTLERHQLVFNQRLYIRTVQLVRFGPVVDEKQHSEFMRTQHSYLRRVSVLDITGIARDGMPGVLTSRRQRESLRVSTWFMLSSHGSIGTCNAPIKTTPHHVGANRQRGSEQSYRPARRHTFAMCCAVQPR